MNSKFVDAMVTSKAVEAVLSSEISNAIAPTNADPVVTNEWFIKSKTFQSTFTPTGEHLLLLSARNVQSSNQSRDHANQSKRQSK